MGEKKIKKGTPKHKASPRQKKDWIAAYILIAPLTIGLILFYIWPFIQNIWFSFNDVNKFNMSTFVGLDNYKQLLADSEVWRSFGNTLKYVFLCNDHLHYQRLPGIRYGLHDDRKNQPGLRGY